MLATIARNLSIRAANVMVIIFYKRLHYKEVGGVILTDQWKRRKFIDSYSGHQKVQLIYLGLHVIQLMIV